MFLFLDYLQRVKNFNFIFSPTCLHCRKRNPTPNQAQLLDPNSIWAQPDRNGRRDKMRRSGDRGGVVAMDSGHELQCANRLGAVGWIYSGHFAVSCSPTSPTMPELWQAQRRGRLCSHHHHCSVSSPLKHQDWGIQGWRRWERRHDHCRATICSKGGELGWVLAGLALSCGSPYGTKKVWRERMDENKGGS